MSVQIKAVSGKKELKTFVLFANEMYKDNDYYVPSIVFDELSTFDKTKNGAFAFCDCQLYLAYKNGKVVGRVAAIINHKANEHWNVRQVRFGWIDFIDDIEVSAALLGAVADFGKAHGMNQIVGPLGFTDFDPEGMLVEGFDRVSTMALIYNHPYYPEHLKKLGFCKETGWIEYRIAIPESTSERHLNLAKAVQQRYDLKILKLSRREIIKQGYGRKFFELINQTYCNLYGFSLLSEQQIDSYVNLYLGLIDTKMITFVENGKGELIGAAAAIPSLAKALQKSRGKFFPFGWWHLFKAMFLKHSETLELLLVGVRPDYQNCGVNALIICDMAEHCRQLGFKYAETNAMLESNDKIQAMLRPFDKEQHKARWVFGKEI